uniref:AGC-kinase C-terminal domain-containing protein n=1 Tax=Echinostoma caproni TaxID=27848 RepID=A0A183ABD8_9TREM
LIPRDARLFYNEEDWNKFKYMTATAKQPGLAITDLFNANCRAFSEPARLSRGGKKPYTDMKFYF